VAWCHKKKYEIEKNSHAELGEEMHGELYDLKPRALFYGHSGSVSLLDCINFVHLWYPSYSSPLRSSRYWCPTQRTPFLTLQPKSGFSGAATLQVPPFSLSVCSLLHLYQACVLVLMAPTHRSQHSPLLCAILGSTALRSCCSRRVLLAILCTLNGNWSRSRAHIVPLAQRADGCHRPLSEPVEGV